VEFFRMDGNRAAKLPFSDAVRVGEVLYLSGQMGVVPGTMKIVPGGIEAETRQMMENIERVLKHCDRAFDDVFKCTVMLEDMAQWAAFNKIYLNYFKPDRLPTRSAFGASGLALGGAVEMECWAHAP
jgi:2-iminobutanoate/2-iminopropanoate deaminase